MKKTQQIQHRVAELIGEMMPVHRKERMPPFRDKEVPVPRLFFPLLSLASFCLIENVYAAQQNRLPGKPAQTGICVYA
jgi:hypothetical protein